MLKNLINKINDTAFNELIDNFLNDKNKVSILSKGGFKTVLSHLNITDKNVEETDYVFISILNTDVVGDNIGYFENNKSNVLILKFDDIVEDIEIKPGLFAKTITDNQSKEIISFIKSNKEKIIGGSKCVIHCSAGVSRSGAVGTFINEYFSFDTNYFNHFNQNIKPNPLVLKKLNKFI